MSKRKIVVLENIKEASEFISRRLLDLATEAIDKRGRFIIGFSGGRTPLKLYQNLSNEKCLLPWDKTHIFLVDERFVSFDKPESNFNMIKENLLDKIDISEKNIHPIFIRGSSSASAKAYEEELKKFFGVGENGLPDFDLIVLGIGEDGHTASLFPEDAALEEKAKLSIAVKIDRLDNERITLTLPVINNSKNIIFLVTGKNKANVVKNVLKKKDASLPASMVGLGHGDLYFVLDKEAASLFFRGDYGG